MSGRIARWMAFGALALAGCSTGTNDAGGNGSTSGEAGTPSTTASSNMKSDLAYGPEPSQQLDLFPAKERGAALVVFVHGGAWIGGGKAIGHGIARTLQEAGFAAASVDYRLSPGVRHPTHAEDVATALGWLSAHADEYGYDAKRIVVVGHSAGAHIAGTIATTPALEGRAGHPAGYVGLEGIYDVPELVKVWPTYPDWFLKKAFGDDAAQWSEASPSRHSPASRAPWLVVHTKGDELVDVGQSDGWSKHLRDAGVKATDLRPEGGSHDGALNVLADPNSEALKALIDFVGHLAGSGAS